MGLEKLNGLSGLSSNARMGWERANANLLRGKSDYFANQLYKNQQFINRYGLEAFRRYNADQREQIYRNAVLNDEVIKRFNPYKMDASGNYIKDKNNRFILNQGKTEADANTFFKLMSLEDDNKEELLNSNWRPDQDIDRQYAAQYKSLGAKPIQLKKTGKGFLEKLFNSLSYETNNDVIGNEDNELTRWEKQKSHLDATVNKRKEDNKKIFDNINAKDLETKENNVSGLTFDIYNNEISKLNDSQIKNLFLTSIKGEKEGTLKNGVFAALFKDGKNISSIAQDFSIDDMRWYLAKEKSMRAVYGDAVASEALNNYSKNYAAERENFATVTGKLIRDIGVSTVTYTADKVNSMVMLGRMIEDGYKGKAKVYVNKDGEVIDKSKVKNGYYVDEKGNKQKVVLQEKSAIDLQFMGKDRNGADMDLFFNNKLLSEAEQFGTLNKKEIEEYRNLGVSPYKVFHAVGEDESNTLYEGFKMMSFGIADALLAHGLRMGGSIGNLMRVAKPVGVLQKTLNGVGKVAASPFAAANYVLPTVSALAIGNAYGRGAFAESFQGNMEKLQEKTYQDQHKRVYDAYDNNAKFKSAIDKEVNKIYSANKSSYENLSATDAKSQIRDNLLNKETQKAIEAYQQTDEYLNDAGYASNAAGTGAIIASLTDAAKYAVVNNFGFRKFLFKSRAERVAENSKKFKEAVQKTTINGKQRWKTDDRLLQKGLNSEKFREAGKTISSQFWGGAWTNFTDDMQTWGGKKINEDVYNKYLASSSKEKLSAINGTNESLSLLEAMTSYYQGANEALYKDSTWQAGLVGALGSAMSITPAIGDILHQFSSKEGRAEWKNMSMGEKANVLINNGLLSDYYAKKGAQRNLNNTVSLVNKMLNDYNDFQAVYDTVALDLSSIDPNNANDEKILDILKGIKSLQTLDQFKGAITNRHENDQFTEMLSQTDSVQKAIELYNTLRNGRGLTEEQEKDLLDTYYAQNPTVEKNEENNQRALEEVRSNANDIFKIQDKYEEVSEKINKHELKNGEINPLIKTQLVTRMVMDHFIDDVLANNESQITGNETISEESTPMQAYGNKESIENRSKVLDVQIAKIEESIKEQKEAIEKKKEAIKNEKDSEKATILQQELYTMQMQQNTFNEMLNNAQLHKKELSDYLENDGSERVLTKEEILALNPIARAMMLNTENYDNYSQEQQQVITQVQKDLIAENNDALNLIQETADLSRKKETNKEMINRIQKDPEGAAVNYIAQRSNAMIEANNLYTYNALKTYDDMLSQTEQTMDEQVASLKNEKTNVLKTALEISDVFDNLSKDTIQEALKLTQIKDFFHNKINEIAIENPMLFSSLIQSFDNIYDVTNNEKSFKETFDEVLKSDSINDTIKQRLKNIWDEYNGVTKQKEATVKPTEKNTKIEENEGEIEIQNATEMNLFPETETPEKPKEKEKTQEEYVVEKAEPINLFSSEENGEEKGNGDSNIKNEVKEEKQKSILSYQVTEKLPFPKEKTEARKEEEKMDGKELKDKFKLYVRKYLLQDSKTERQNITLELKSDTGKETLDEYIAKMKQENDKIPDAFKEGTLKEREKVYKLYEEYKNSNESLDELAHRKDVEQQIKAEKVKDSDLKLTYQSHPELKQVEDFLNTEELKKIINECKEKDELKKGIIYIIKNSNSIEDLIDSFRSQSEFEGNSEIIRSALKEIYSKLQEKFNAKEDVKEDVKEDTEKTIITETIDDGNKSVAASVVTSQDMIGNTFYRYDVDASEKGQEVERKGRKENDNLNKFFNWLDKTKTKLQKIIDLELNKISKLKPKVYVMTAKDSDVNNVVFTVVEYTDKVKALHNEEYGGVIEANGKKYLIVGTMGYNPSNTTQRNSFFSVKDKLRDSSRSTFESNKSDYYVDESSYTEIKKISSGRITTQQVTDTSKEIRPMSEILKDSSRNPRGLKMKDLKWGIQVNSEFKTINTSSEDVIYSPKDSKGNNGGVFILVESSNGNYVPVKIQTTTLQDLKQDSKLKNKIEELVKKLNNTSYAERKSAIDQLVQMLVLSDKETTGTNQSVQILIGTEEIPTLTIKQNGKDVAKWDLSKTSVSDDVIYNAVLKANPEINITLTTLKDETMLNIYDEAGALNTDIAGLYTFNASVDLYNIGRDGKPIITQSENVQSETLERLDKDKEEEKKNTVYLAGDPYRKRNGKWYNKNNKEVTSNVQLSKLEWLSYIRRNNLPIVAQENGYRYYIVNKKQNEEQVVKLNDKNEVTVLSKEQSKTTLDILKKREEKKQKDKKVEKKLEEVKTKENNENEVEIVKQESMDLSQTEEKLAEQGTGEKPIKEKKEEKTKIQEECEKIVEEIHTDTQGLKLSEDGKYYVDEQGNKYARTTSIIYAMIGDKWDISKFDPNSPWVTPSTSIGTAVDLFVRDFFDGNLGDLDTLAERYPNATQEQWISLLHQLQDLRTKLHIRNLIIVPKDVTLTGEIEVEHDGKTYILPIAGTLDLLAYDKNTGMFFIFDMKTTRTLYNQNRNFKWSLQMGLYAQMLKRKYGVNVSNGSNIIQFEVGYPAPSESTKYSNEKDSLQLLKNGEHFNTEKLNFIGLQEVVNVTNPIEYEKLGENEKQLLKLKETPTSKDTKGKQEKVKSNNQRDINDTNLDNLQEIMKDKNQESQNLITLLNDKPSRDKIRETLKKKGFTFTKKTEIIKWFTDKNIPTTNITDIDTLLDIITNCR